MNQNESANATEQYDNLLEATNIDNFTRPTGIESAALEMTIDSLRESDDDKRLLMDVTEGPFRVTVWGVETVVLYLNDGHEDMYYVGDDLEVGDDLVEIARYAKQSDDTNVRNLHGDLEYEL